MPNGCVVIQLDEEHLTRACVVLKAALSLYHGDIDVVLTLRGVEHPTDAQGEAIGNLCREVAAGEPMPDIFLLGVSAAAQRDPLVTIAATDDPAGVVEAIVLLTSVALRSWGEADGHSADTDATRYLAQRDALIAQRDGLTPAGVPVRFAVIAQVQSTWGAVEPVVQALRESGCAVDVVAIDSEHEMQPVSTAEFIRRRGFEPKDLSWLVEHYADPSRGLAAVLFYDPWDGLRPEAATAQFAAEHGVRVAYLPYSPNAAAGEKMEQLSYDLPMHRLAWRIYARSEEQRRRFERHCAVGGAQVRVLGTAKMDRVLRAQNSTTTPPWVQAAAGRPIVLWNPHFSVGAGGWSTFETHASRILQHVRDHDDFFLLVRPHFRILRDCVDADGAPVGALRQLLDAQGRYDNLAIDRSPDYLDAFQAADALISDLSSLVTEFYVTGKPILYLHREDGPGINEDAHYFLTCDVASDTDEVIAFLDAVRSGSLGGATRRALGLARYFAHEDGHAGLRIAHDLVSGAAESLVPTRDVAR